MKAMRLSACNLFTSFLMLCAAQTALSQTPEWIWHDNGGKATADDERRFFRKTFNVSGEIKKAVLTFTTDNEGVAFVNGAKVGESKDWQEPDTQDITKRLVSGDNVLAIRGVNKGGTAAVLARLEITLANNQKLTVATDLSWTSSATEQDGWTSASANASGWTKVVSLGKLGVAPWGDVLNRPANAATSKREATPAASLFTLPGFKVELIASAETGDGSWVAIAKDDKGRLIISPQFPKSSSDTGLLRVTMGPDGKVAKKELIAKPLYDAQGLCFASGALYVVVNKYSTTFDSGLYRVSDKGNDQFDDIKLLKKIPGNGEHGPHAVVRGPDGMLYVMAGNHTKLVPDVSPDSPHKNYAEDFVTPRQWDAQGHAAGILAPGGQIYRTDMEGKKWDLMLAGFRNSYDFDFNADGEIFTYDSDMEWEWGMHWYRPTRVYHCVSGGEYGWRSGSAKFPAHYTDGLPPTLDVGVGCPTGTRFGYGAKFPAKYQKAYYILDWTYGRIMAVHLTPDGASYRSTMENFIAPKGLVRPGEPKPPLNVTDIEIGDDGALYFTTGGRNTQAGLYRVTYAGKESTAKAKVANSSGNKDRTLRHQLEAFHGHQDPKAVAFLWPYLNDDDRWIRYAARIALEAQPVTEWKARALAEKKVNAGLTALMALARVGGKESQDDCLKALARFPLASLKEDKQLEKLRIVEISFARHGKPSPEVAKLATDKLNAAFPARSEVVNRELCSLLTYLEAPAVVSKTLTLLDSTPVQEQQLSYLFSLRSLATGWTPGQREHFFTELNSHPKANAQHPPQLMRWFKEAGRPYGDGASFRKQLDKMREDAVATLSADEKVQLADLISFSSANSKAAAKATLPKPRTRTFVKEWKMDDIAPALDKSARGRNFDNGRQVFVDAQCSACHKMGDEGGGTGPDLTAVAARFNRRDVLESMVEPSRVVSEQFQNITVNLKNGDDFTGRLVDETAEKIVLQPNPLAPDKVEVKKADVKSRQPSKLSPMPEGLINVLSKEDILDLLAYLDAGGRRDHPAFKR